MKNKLGITDGVWDISKSNNVFANGKVVFAHQSNFDDIQRQANAKLIADAGTTANKCGKLPSQLLQENEEMKAICNYLFEKVNKPVARHKINAEFYDRYHEIQLLLTKINQQ